MDTIQQKIRSTAAGVFGISAVKPHQNLVMHTILENSLAGRTGRGLLAVFPTGSGKSLCFLLPAVLLPGVSVIIYPLLGLMNDQSRRLEAMGIPHAVLRGGQSAQVRKKIFARLESSGVKIVLTNPETLASPGVLGPLSRIGVSLAVIDEVHVVPGWGGSFRHSYRALGFVLPVLRPSFTAAFTATATEETVRDLTWAVFGGRRPLVIRADPDRTNILYRRELTLSKTRTVTGILRSCPRPALVFCQTRIGTEELFYSIRRALPDIPVRFYHAGLDAGTRKRTELWFLGGNDGVLICTCAFGMGMDKPDIRTVIHRDLPGGIEAFFQESGRAGRDGLQSVSYTLLDPDDIARSRRNPDSGQAGIVRVFAQNRSCYRAGLLSLMGFEAGGCSGCDVCLGSTGPQVPWDMKLIIRSVRRAPLQLNQRRLCLGLTGTGTVADALGPEYGVLDGWTRENVEEALENLRRSGWIKAAFRGNLVARPFVKIQFGPAVAPGGESVVSSVHGGSDGNG